MPRWKRGELTIEQLISMGHLSTLTKSVSDGSTVLGQAKLRLKVAESALEIDPDGAYTNAYDAARLAATALLTQQGLRPTVAGGHRVVEEALLAQFGDGFARFSVLRRRRHELDYPTATYSQASGSEAAEAVSTARLFVDTAETLLPELGFFRDDGAQG